MTYIFATRRNLFIVHFMVITLNKMQIESWHRKQITMELISLLTLIDSDLSKNVLSSRVKPNHKNEAIIFGEKFNFI